MKLGWLVPAAVMLSCAHARPTTGATAELEDLRIRMTSRDLAEIDARFRVSDAPGWGPGVARLTLTFDDRPLATVMSFEQQEGDFLSIPILVDLTQAPEELQQHFLDGTAMEVGVRGTLEVRVLGQPIRFPVAVEHAAAAERS